MEFLAEISLMIQIQLIKPVQKKQGLILDEFSHVNGSLLLFVHEGPGAKAASASRPTRPPMEAPMSTVSGPQPWATWRRSSTK